jgi:hypothetical protein
MTKKPDLKPLNQISQAYQTLLGAFKDQAIESILFTTFNFSSGFFEKNVLPLVGGNDSESAAQLKPSQVNATLLHSGSGADLSPNVTVVCDRSTNPEPKGNYRYGLLAVGLENAFFHPKIILATGTLKDNTLGAVLMVGSCNMTLSGWGLNREVAGLCQVGLQQQAALMPLLNWIKTSAEEQAQLAGFATDTSCKEEGDIRLNLTTIQQFITANCTNDLTDEPQFYARIADAKNQPETFLATLIKPLATDKPFNRCQIVSPFWSENHNLQPLFNTLKSQQIAFVPSITHDGSYKFPSSIRNAIEETTQYQYQCFKETERYTHAKTLTLTTDDTVHYLLGSANFTYAAMGPVNQGNIEAMLSYSLAKPIAALPALLPLNDPNWADDDSAEEGPTPLPWISVATYDWKNKTFKCVLQCSEPSFAKIKATSFNQQVFKLKKQQADQYYFESEMALTKPVYCFNLLYKPEPTAPTQSCQGLVTQLNGDPDQLGYLPKPDLATILAQLRGLNPQGSPGRGGGFTSETASASNEAEDEVTAEFDFFSMFQAFYKIKQYFEHKAEQKSHLNPFVRTTANSLATFYRAATLDFDDNKTSDTHCIRHFILLSELQVTTSQLKTRYKEKDIVEAADKLISDINASLAEVEDKFIALIGQSPMLKQFLGKKDIKDLPATVIFDWFKAQLSVGN